MAAGHDLQDVDLFSVALTHAYVDGNRRFRPRNWLAERVDRHLRDPECRFVLLTAAPGAGKSAFMAWLADKHRKWPRYFIRETQSTQFDDPHAQSFLLKVGLQLAARFPDLFSDDAIKVAVEQRLGSVETAVAVDVGRLIASPFHQVVIDIRQQVGHGRGDVTGLRIGEWVTDPRRLPAAELQFYALLDPAMTLARTHPGQRIVVLIDGLDEIRYRGGTGAQHGETLLDWLAQCPKLPPNLRLVLTSRPDEPLLARFRGAQTKWLRELRIDPAEPDVRTDLAGYARALAAEPWVAAALDAGGATSAFVDNAVDKANGNIGYLDAVARAVDNAVKLQDADLLRGSLALTALPDTLAELNAHFLRQVRDRVGNTVVEIFEPAAAETRYLPAWPAVHRPILGVLTVARRPLAPDEIRALAGIGADLSHVADALEMLRQFLDRAGTGYRLYHTSLAQLLTDPATRENPDLVSLYQDPAMWHARIAARGAATIERLRPGEVGPSDVPPYLLRHLGHHLEQSGADLDRLTPLAGRPWLDAWRASDQLEWGVLADVGRVGRAAAALNQRSVTALEHPPALHWEMTAALIRAGLVSMSSGTPPALLGAMLDSGEWTAERALDDVRQAPRPLERALGLIAVATHVGTPRAAVLLDEALGMIDLLEDGDRDAVRTAECLAALAVGDPGRGLHAQREVHDEAWRTATLAENAAQLIAALDEEALLAGLEGLRATNRLQVLVAWSPRAALARRAIAAADDVDEPTRAVALLGIALASPDEHAHLVDRALDLAEEVSGWGMGDEFCRAVFTALPPALNAGQMDRCLTVLDRIADRDRHVGPVAAELVRQYPPDQQHVARRWVIDILLQEGSIWRSPDLFAQLVSDLYDDEVSLLLPQFAENDRHDVVPIVLALADRVSDAEFDARAHAALTALIGLDHDRGRQAGIIAAHIPARRWARVLELAESIRADDGLALTRPGEISSRGVQRVPMTQADRHAALCEILSAAADVLPVELVGVAARFVTAGPDRTARCATLTALLPRARGELRHRIARDALDGGRAGFSNDALRDLLAALPADLPVQTQRMAVEAAAGVWRGARTAAISALAPTLAAEPLRELYRAAHRIDDRGTWAEFVAAATPFATPSAATAWVEILIGERIARAAVAAAAHSRLDNLPRLLRLHDEISDATTGADYLAALAPQLEPGELDDALQRLSRHAIPLLNLLPPHRCLAVLARRCAQLGEFGPALDTIGRWPNEWARSEALRAMSGSHAPDLAGEVELLARNLSRPGARANALCAVAPFAADPGALRAEVLETGIQPSICLAVLATGWPDEYDMPAVWRRTVEGTVWHLDPDDLDEALTRSPPDVGRQAVDLMADRIESLPAKHQFFTFGTMAVLPRHATEEQLMRLARLAHGVTDVHEWAQIATPLLEHARPETREALTAAARFEGRRPGTGAERITDIVAARFAPDPVRRHVISTTTTAIRQGHDWLLQYLTPLLVRQPVDHAYQQLSDIVEERSAHGRDTLFKALTALAPAIGHVAGPQGTAEVLDAARRVCDWWP